MLAVSSFFSKSYGKRAGCLTKRAPDVWESARFRSIFLASGFSCSQAESTPAHTQVTQSVSPPHVFVGFAKKTKMKQCLYFALILFFLPTACISTKETHIPLEATSTEMHLPPTETPVLLSVQPFSTSAELPTDPKILWTEYCDPRITKCSGPDNLIETNLAIHEEFYRAIDSVNGTIVYDVPYSKWDLESYSMIIVDFCGTANENTTTAIKQYIESGGSAIITGSGWCDTSSYASQITEDFGVTFTNDNDKTNQWSNSIKYHSITNGVNKLFFFRHAYLNVTSPSQVIVEVSNANLLKSEKMA
jgi:hypothetical protein